MFIVVVYCLLFVVYHELIFKRVCSLQLGGQDVYWYIHTWEVAMEIIHL